MDVVKKTIKDIISLKIQGASEVRKKAMDALVKATKSSKAKNEEAFRKEFLANAHALFFARPTEPELRTALRIIKKSISEKSLSIDEMKERVEETAENYEKEKKQALAKIAQYGAEMIEPHSTVLTHCHSHSVIDVLKKAAKKIDAVYSCETRPLYQGRITAKELSDAGLNVTLIVDNAASTVMKKCNYLFTGADAFLADGDVINKIGTNQLSIACTKYDVKHYAVTSTKKFEPASFFGKEEPIEQRNPSEVWESKGKNGRGKIKVMNPAFDRTNADQIEGIICELGIFDPKTLAGELYDKLKLDKHHLDFLRL